MKMILYHGTDKKFNIGDILNPKSNWVNGKEEREKVGTVFATPSFDWAEYFAVRLLYSHGMNKICGTEGVFSIVSSDKNSEPFSVAKDRKYYVYRVKADGFRLSNPDKRGNIQEHVSESPVEILEIARVGTLAEWLDRGNKIYVVPDSIMNAAWPQKKSFVEILPHAVPYLDWSGGVKNLCNAKIGGRD
ncbi:MAG: hypothetical protein LBT45_02075 [Rickettsiales bacterium]|jgi:hypothetical protein|nr:hypothetical protein [Rickettsiales bacterium]